MTQATSPSSGARQSLREVVRQFGFPIERFIPGRGPSKTLRIVGLVDALLGIGLAVWAAMSEKLVPWGVLGAGLAVAGIAAVVIARRLGSGGVLVCPRGLIVARLGQVESCEWDQMTAIRETAPESAEEKRPGGDGFIIDRKNGTPWTIDAATLGNPARFREVLQRESSKRKVRWVTASKVS